MPLFDHLREQRVPAPEQRPVTPLEELLGRYRHHLAHDRGLAPLTVLRYLRMAKRFLVRRASQTGGETGAEDLGGAEITGYLLECCSRLVVESAKREAADLRALLRFLYLQGLTATDLGSAMPPVAGWRDTRLPATMSSTEVAALLDGCDRSRPAGLRDLAVLSLLGRLGLRSGEVAALQLGDIDWRAGEILVRGKARRDDRLPLTVEAGEAIAAYLRHGRPPSQCRQVILLRFLQDRTGEAPSSLDWQDLNAEAVTAFLDHLETDRHNSARSRNARLAALRSLFRYAALRHPEHAQLIQQVLAIPQKRFDRALVSFLSPDEVDALLAAPDIDRWEGRRDRALMTLAVQTGLRLSELIGLDCGDVQLGTGPYVRCTGKGRKQRCTPLTTSTVALLRTWLQERGIHDEPLFPTRTGRRLSDDAVERRVAIHKTRAAQHCPSLATKKLTPHVLRHTTAMSLLHAGVDIAVIALWLGHADIRSTQLYLHADMTIKERALARTTPPSVRAGRYRPTDSLLAFLENL